MIKWGGDEHPHVVYDPIECSECNKLICKKCFNELPDNRRYCRNRTCPGNNERDEAIKFSLKVN